MNQAASKSPSDDTVDRVKTVRDALKKVRENLAAVKIERNQVKTKNEQNRTSFENTEEENEMLKQQLEWKDKELEWKDKVIEWKDRLDDLRDACNNGEYFAKASEVFPMQEDESKNMNDIHGMADKFQRSNGLDFYEDQRRLFFDALAGEIGELDNHSLLARRPHFSQAEAVRRRGRRHHDQVI